MEKAEKRRRTLVSVDDEVKERTKDSLAALSTFAKAGKAYKAMFETKAESGRDAEAVRTMYMEGNGRLYESYLNCFGSIRKTALGVLGKKKKKFPISVPLLLWSRLEQGLSLPANYSEELEVLRPLAPYMVAVLQIPLVSCEDERVFSSAAHIYTPYRQRLKATAGAAILMARINPKLKQKELEAELFVEGMLGSDVWSEGFLMGTMLRERILGP